MSTDLVRTVDPESGEVLELAGLSDVDLAGVFEQAVDRVGRLNAFGEDVKAELVRRLDARNERRARLDTDHEQRLEVETNAATVDEYPVDATRDALRELVDAGVLAESVIGRVIVTPDPKPQAPRVDKRELNKLKAHDDPRVAAALGRVRDRVPQRRTLKVERKEAASG